MGKPNSPREVLARREGIKDHVESQVQNVVALVRRGKGMPRDNLQISAASHDRGAHTQGPLRDHGLLWTAVPVSS